MKINYKHLTWGIWLLFTLGIIFFANHHRTVSINYWLAAQHWLAQQPLYQNNGKGFIYLPQSAILYLPLAKLPFALSEAIWRILSLSVFAWGLFRFTPLLTVSAKAQVFLGLTLLAILLCFDSARNGQMHLLTTGLLMLATVAISQTRWRKATFLIVLAFFLKPTAIVFLLLTAGIFFAETGIYFIGWGLLFMLLPFFTQAWHYVISQYLACITMLQIAAQVGSAQDWAQFFNLIAQTGWEMPYFLQTIVRMTVAYLFLLLGYFIKKRCSLPETAVWLLMLAMEYLMLFNPRTENNDYMMLTPVLAYCLVNSMNLKKIYHLGFLLVITLGLIGSYYVSNLFPGHHNWSAPLMGVLLLGYLLRYDILAF